MRERIENKNQNQNYYLLQANVEEQGKTEYKKIEEKNKKIKRKQEKMIKNMKKKNNSSKRYSRHGVICISNYMWSEKQKRS